MAGVPKDAQQEQSDGTSATAPVPLTKRWGVLRVIGVSKRFEAVAALRDVSMDFTQGTVHGLIGQNGAGKSTLVKILSGLLAPDAGRLELDGSAVTLHSPTAAAQHGIATAFQELTLIPHLSVAENLVLGKEKAYRASTFGTAVRAAKEVLSRWGVSEVDPRRIVTELPLALQQRIEVTKALERSGGLLLLDEPTSALSPEGVRWLKDQIRLLRSNGHAIVIISHRLAEIEDICDVVSVLRDGRAVATVTVQRNAANADRIAELMLGRELVHTAQEPASRASSRALDNQPILRGNSLSLAPTLQDVSISLGSGEIVGVAALEGHGQRELFLALFGAVRPESGSVEIEGAPARLRGPRDAIRRGICLVPEDRKSEGLFLGRSVRENLNVVSLKGASRWGFVSYRRELDRALPVMKMLNLDPRTLDGTVSALSGGNQQKVVVGKWLVQGAKTLLMYDPLRGVDVGAKAEFFEWMRHFVSAEHRGILFYSSDIDELIPVCGRIVTLYRGRLSGEFDGEQLTREAVLRGILGGTDRASA